MSYAFDHEWEQERKRLKRLEAGMDPGTIRCFDSIKVEAGWKCLEIGAGGGSIAQWLCQRVGPSGHVVATDLQTSFVEAIDASNLEVRKHDIVTDDLEHGEYNLVHSRAVLEHLPGRDEVLKKLVAALRPGGWLVLESHDFLTMVPAMEKGADAFQKVSNALLKTLGSTGFDPAYGRKVGIALRREGLRSIGMEGRFYEIGGALPLTSVWSLVVQRLAQPLTESGLLTAQEIEETLQLVAGEDFIALSPAIVAAWGQRKA